MDEKKDKEDFRRIFSNFAQKTSFGAIPQILNSQHLILKVVWVLGLFIGITMLVVNLYLNVSEYLEFNVNTFYSEGLGKPVFPDVTLCNIYQFNNGPEDKTRMSWDHYQWIFSKQGWQQEDIRNKINMSLIDSAVDDIMKWRYDYQEEEEQELEQEQEDPSGMNKTEVEGSESNLTHRNNNYIEKERVEKRKLRSQLLSEVLDYMKDPSMYFANVPYNIDRKFEPSPRNMSSFIEHCRFLTWKGYFMNCDSHIQEIWNPDFFKCYTLRPSRREDIREFTAIVYINNFPEHQAEHFPFTSRRTKATGIRLAVHSPGTKPKMMDGVSISPGTETTVSIVPLNRTRLTKPWSDTDCTQQTYLNGSDTEMYSFEGCREICIQEEVISKCGCLSGFHQFTKKQWDRVDGRVCGNQSLNEIWEEMVKDPEWWNNMSVWLTGPRAVRGVNEIICLWYGIDYDTDHCKSKCLLPCKEYIYTTSTSSASWPHVYYHKAFYQEYISQKEDLKRKFSAYGRLIEHALCKKNCSFYKNMTSEFQLARKMKNLTLIEENFLQVTVKFQTRKPFVFVDTKKYTWDSALGMFGGTIGLWSGLSLLATLEFIDLCYCVLAYLWAHYRKSWTGKPRVEIASKPALDEVGNNCDSKA